MKDRGLVAGTIALIIVAAFCAFAVYIGFFPTPAANQHFIDLALGALIAQFANVTGYYFGSSKSAERAAVPERPPVTVPLPRMPVPPDNDFHQRDT